MNAPLPPPFEGRKQQTQATRFQFTRIVGARIAQLQLCAESSAEGVAVGQDMSPEEVCAVEVQRGCVPLVLYEYPPAGSKPGTKPRVVALAPGGREVKVVDA